MRRLSTRAARLLGTVSLALILPAALAAQTPSRKAPPKTWDARLDSFEGDVQVRLAGQAEWTTPEKNQTFQNGDQIRVGDKGKAVIAFRDSGIIGLRSNSHLVIESLDPGDATLRLKAGTLLQKLKSLDVLKNLFGRKAQWKIITPTAVAAVRGTEFAVQVSTDSQTTTVGVFDQGKVVIASAETKGPETTLSPNQEASVLPGGQVGQAGPLKKLVGYRAQMRQLRTRLAQIQRRYRKEIY